MDYIKASKIIHVTGITPALSESARDVVFEVIRIAKEIAEIFLAMGCKIVAVKLGAEGCYVADKDGGKYKKGFTVEVTDTVGAGDGFAAGFLSGILKGLSLEECGTYGNALGAMATLVNGDMEGYPYLDQLLQFMGKKKSID